MSRGENKTIKTWMVELVGRQAELEAWDNWFDAADARVDQHRIEDEQPGYFLESNSFDNVRDIDIHTTAADLVSLMNGVAKISGLGCSVWPERLPVMVFSDGSRERTKLVVADYGVQLESLASVGGELTRRAAVSDELGWLRVAQRDSEVADALHHFIQSNGWFDIYKTGEVIESSIKGGRPSLDKKGWTEMGRYKALMQTANYFRHSNKGRLNTKFPLSKTPPSIDESRALMGAILKEWIKERK